MQPPQGGDDKGTNGHGTIGIGNGTNLKSLLEAYERQLIETALAATAGNQRRAAATLGLLPTTLHEKMKRLGLLRRAPAASFDELVSEAP